MQATLGLLLEDKTTKRNIIWATDTYAALGSFFEDDCQIYEEAITGLNRDLIQPRIAKALSEQADRTKKHAEVFTPAWICNQMNNYCDAEWFGRENVFNRQNGMAWIVNEHRIHFPDGKIWQDYVLSLRLEITCGEAPFIVSRYDAATGEPIDIKRRIGQLDRKLRVVNENTADETEWMEWTLKAFQSVYGYEYQGDNLLIARINLLMTFVDYLKARWEREPTKRELLKVANIIAWNFWQMDGLKGVVPLGKTTEQFPQFSLFEPHEDYSDDNLVETECHIFDWRSRLNITYNSLKKGRENK